MVPFFIFYSMFGFQRVGDLIWAAADARARGFLMGATAGRTTLLGEGLQHQDGHSLVLASTVPACQAYDPAFAYEVAAIVRHGIHQHVRRPEDPEATVFYYLTLYNENYPMPAMPEGVPTRAWSPACTAGPAPPEGDGGPGHDPVLRHRPRRPPGPPRRSWPSTTASAPSCGAPPGYKQLREEALAVERVEPPPPRERAPHAAGHQPAGRGARPDRGRHRLHAAVPDQIARWVPRPYTSLGTDGFGRSDTREALRRFFETDAGHVAVAVLSGLARAGAVDPSEVDKAVARHGIDPDVAPPWTR